MPPESVRTTGRQATQRPPVTKAVRERARRWLHRLLTEGDCPRRAADESMSEQQARKR
jgi:hypothetical protein